MTKHATVIVANRLPITVKKSGGKLVYERSNGGLATAMASLDAEDMVWVGWPGIASDDLTNDEQAEVARELAKMNAVPVFLSRQHIELFYEGYANDTLWPLFHYFQNKAEYHRDYWKAYREVNHLYEAATRRCALSDATIWIHDYHLMILPALLRKKLASAKIGYFHHIPFPSFEVYRLLPERRELLEGLLGADLIGFHIYDYARHFLSSCLRLLGLRSHSSMIDVDGRRVHVDAFPIGIDYESFATTRLSEETASARQSLAETYDEEKIILSIDRLDYSKGIPERLTGYQRFLEEYPQYLGKVRLVMVAVPSRVEIGSYKQLRDAIEMTVSRINGEFGTSEWAPISYQFQNLPFPEIVALYAQADVMLVTPLRDGMNLVAKEFVAAKGNEPGVLVLSEMTGAAEELTEAIIVNPNDVSAIARSIKQALELSRREQLRRLEAMQVRLRTATVAQWGQNFLEQLKRTYEPRDAVTQLHAPMNQTIRQQFQAAHKRLIVLDYDGTLQTFKPSPAPSAARPPKEVKDTLARLAAQPGTTVAIVSGRSRAALDSWFGDTPIQLVAEHGAWVKQDGTWQCRAGDFEPTRQIVTPIMEEYTSRTHGSLIEQKDFATVWHYRNVAVELAQVRMENLRLELHMALTATDARVHSGNMILEVKPRGVSKAEAVQYLRERYAPDMVLMAGDDYTDEDMFATAREGDVSIKVGLGPTEARYRVGSVVAVRGFLKKLMIE